MKPLFKIGQSVIIRSDNDNENYEDYTNQELVITHNITYKSTNQEEHILYSLQMRKTGEKVPFSLYDYELEQY